MNAFIKVQIASIAGSAADYVTTIILIEIFHCWYLFGNFAGNLIGGTIQFMLCRNWALPLSRNKMQNQVIRFVLVFAGNLLLSAVGVYLITHFLHFNYIISKTVVSVLLGLSYNYYMQKKWVFA